MSDEKFVLNKMNKKIELPQENPEKYMYIHDLHENSYKTYIDMGVSRDLIRHLNVEQWFEAFETHYQFQMKKFTSENCLAVFQREKDHPNSYGPTIYIPSKNPRIKFVLDLDHSALKFNIGEGDEQARDIVYSFLEKLFSRGDKK